MAELKIFYKDNEKIKVARTISALKQLDKKDIIWIDLLDVSDKTEDTLEGFLKIDVQPLYTDGRQHCSELQLPAHEFRR